MDQQPVSGTDEAGVEGSQGQVRQTAEAAGNGVYEETVAAGTEATGSEQAPADNHVPGAAESEEYWEDLCVKEGTYNEGETVYDGYNCFYQFKVPKGQTITVTKDTSLSEREDGLVNTPFEKFYDVYPNEGGVHDGLERISSWISKKIQLMDGLMKYSNEFVLGDVNHDGKIDIVDVTNITNYILNKNHGSFYEAEADVNQDGVISITDVTYMVNLILSK
jgi:hypothetical protein